MKPDSSVSAPHDTELAAAAPRSDRPYRDPVQSQPVLWWQLINELEAFTAATGWGLAGVWGHVHAEDYPSARAQFDQTAADYRSATTGIGGDL